MALLDRHIAINAGWIAGPAIGVAGMAASVYIGFDRAVAGVLFWTSIAVFCCSIVAVVAHWLKERSPETRVIGPAILVGIAVLCLCGAGLWRFWPSPSAAKKTEEASAHAAVAQPPPIPEVAPAPPTPRRISNAPAPIVPMNIPRSIVTASSAGDHRLEKEAASKKELSRALIRQVIDPVIESDGGKFYWVKDGISFGVPAAYKGEMKMRIIRASFSIDGVLVGRDEISEWTFLYPDTHRIIYTNPASRLEIPESAKSLTFAYAIEYDDSPEEGVRTAGETVDFKIISLKDSKFFTSVSGMFER